ncbi:MAG TPA: NUDIX domain-containing protein [Bacillota bacterium]|nr:NUDIX domain-containing protein [Bacillota bacterium]
MKPIRNSAKAIIIEQGKLLLTKNIDHAGFFYLFPGGGQEPGEALKETLIRECIEEIGCQISMGELIFIREYIGKNHEFSEWDSDVHQVEFYFKCVLKSGDETAVNGKNPDSMQVDVEWVPLEKLDEIRLYPKELSKKLKANSWAPIYLGDVN